MHQYLWQHVGHIAKEGSQTAREKPIVRDKHDAACLETEAPSALSANNRSHRYDNKLCEFMGNTNNSRKRMEIKNGDGHCLQALE